MSCFIQSTLLILILFLSLFVSVHLLFGKAILRSRNQYSGVTRDIEQVYRFKEAFILCSTERTLEGLVVF